MVGRRSAVPAIIANDRHTDGVPDLGPWMDLVAEADAVSFFNWQVRPDRLLWSKGAEESMGLTPGALGSFCQWRRYVDPQDAEWITADVANRIRSTGRLRFRYRFLPPGGAPRVMEAVGRCLYGPHGQLDRIIGVMRDVTETVETARTLAALRGQFLRRARLDSVGAVAAGFAHELNQPLAAAANYLAAVEIEARAIGEEALLAFAERGVDQIGLAGDIIRRLRTFLSGEDRFPEWLSVAEIVKEAVTLALPGPERARLHVAIGVEPDLRVFADRVQLQQAMINVLQNAARALAIMPERSRSIVITGRTEGEQVEIAISDTGPGFSSDMLERFAQSLATAGEPGGMGVGLSICRHIMEERGGELLIANGAGGGGVVRLMLPVDPAKEGL